MKQRRNTLDLGSVRYIVFKENDTWYGVALEFNLVVEGDDQQTVFFDLQNAIRGYLAAARKSKLRTKVLNQKSDREYEALWDILESVRENRTSRLLHRTSLR